MPVCARCRLCAFAHAHEVRVLRRRVLEEVVRGAVEELLALSVRGDGAALGSLKTGQACVGNPKGRNTMSIVNDLGSKAKGGYNEDILKVKEQVELCKWLYRLARQI